LDTRKKNPMTMTEDQMREALSRSGYLLESRLERILESHGYYVDANTAYPDPSTGKSRELDIFAMSAVRVTKEMDFVFPVLLIECVNNPQPLILFTKESVIRGLDAHDVPVSGLPVKFPDSEHPREWIALADYLHIEKFHHYCRGRVATQFCSFTRKGNTPEWLAQHEGSHFDSFQKLSDALNHYRRDHFTSWYLGRDEPINIQIYYPALLLQGRLIDARVSKGGVSFKPASRLSYRRTIIHQQEATSIQIDVLTESNFSSWLKTIDKEVQTIARRLRRRRSDVQKSIKRIVTRAKRFRNKEKIIKEMDF
jgi:hypothetical protein